MGDLLAAAILLITVAGGLSMLAAGFRSLLLLARERFSDFGLDTVRRHLASAIVGALSFMSAATLLKWLTLQDWTAIALFALVVALRLLIKRSLAPVTAARVR